MLETVKAFSAISEEYVEVHMRLHPVEATLLGIHDYDARLPNDSPAGLRERSTWLRDIEQRLVASVPWKELPSEQRVDYALLRSQISAERADLEEIRVFARNPAVYPQRALEGVLFLVARPFAPLEERKENILSRLQAIPDYLKSVLPNFDRVPDVYFGLGSEIALSGPAFVDEVVRMLTSSFPGEVERIEHAGNLARRGFLQYVEFLDRDLEPKVGGNFAIGERWMNYKLEREHLLEQDCAALEALGLEHVAKIQAQLDDEARRLDPNRGWREQLDDAAKRHPESLRLREAYGAEVDRARAFVLEKGLAPLAPGEKLEVVETPVFERPITPYAAYLPPGPFDGDSTGVFYVTPVDSTRRKEEQEQQLRGHSYSSLGLTTVHEAYPGHHLQLSHANQVGSRLRRMAMSPLFAEGWALYCEELMYEQGFFLDPVARLQQLKDLLFRACRVVVDVGIHTERMTFMQAVDYLVQNAQVERVNALMEVKRYAATPTQPMSYLVGKLQLIELREKAKKIMPTFDLNAFHTALLSSGTIPPSLVGGELEARLSGRPPNIAR